MGAIISEIDPSILLGDSNPSSKTKCSQFEEQIKNQLNLLEISGKTQGDIHKKILIMKQVKMYYPVASLTPKKLGRLQDSKRSKNRTLGYGNTNQMSACSNSRIIDFKVLHKETEQQLQIHDNYGKMKKFIMKTRHIAHNNELLPLLQRFTKNKKDYKPFKNSLNLIRYKIEGERTFCSSRYTVQALFQYEGSHTLEEQIVTRSSSNDEHFSILQIIKFFKFFMETIRQYQQHNLICPVFSLAHIVISQRNHSLKYKNLLDIKYFQFEEDKNLFYCPQNLGRGKLMNNDEKESIFSFGMCMLAICLLTDLSDCYDYLHSTVCVSLLQQKIEELKTKNQFEYWVTFCQTLEAMVNPKPEDRPNLTQISKCCNLFINQMRVYDCDTTQMMLSEISTCYNRPTKIFQQKAECITGRSCQKQLQKANILKKQSQLSAAKCQTARWNCESSKKKSTKQKRDYFQENRAIDKENAHTADTSGIQKLSSFQEIDLKWKIEDQIFKNMPSFDQLSDQNFMFNVDIQFPKSGANRHSQKQTLLTYRKLL